MKRGPKKKATSYGRQIMLRLDTSLLEKCDAILSHMQRKISGEITTRSAAIRQLIADYNVSQR